MRYLPLMTWPTSSATSRPPRPRVACRGQVLVDAPQRKGAPNPAQACDPTPLPAIATGSYPAAVRRRMPAQVSGTSLDPAPSSLARRPSPVWGRRGAKFGSDNDPGLHGRERQAGSAHGWRVVCASSRETASGPSPRRSTASTAGRRCRSAAARCRRGCRALLRRLEDHAGMMPVGVAFMPPGCRWPPNAALALPSACCTPAATVPQRCQAGCLRSAGRLVVAPCRGWQAPWTPHGAGRSSPEAPNGACTA
jgi:hypothetical protein